MKILLVFLAAAIAGCATVVPAPSTVLVPAPDQVPGPGPEFGPPLGPGPGLESSPLPAPPAHTENLAIAIWQRLAPRLNAAQLHRVRVYETPDLFVDFYGEDFYGEA